MQLVSEKGVKDETGKEAKTKTHESSDVLSLTFQSEFNLKALKFT